MKKLLAALLALSTVLPSLSLAQVSGQIQGLGQSQPFNLVAGPQNRADGTASGSISDREGDTKVTLGHAEYAESARRGHLFTLSANAYTIIAANASAGIIGVLKPILGFYNPLGSGVNAVLVNAKAFHTSGTTGGPLMWNFYCGQSWTPAAGGTPFVWHPEKRLVNCCIKPWRPHYD